jgi:hypothetical protein
MQVATCYAPITKISIRLYSSIANRERACIHHELHVTWASEASQLNPRTWKKNWFIKGNEIYQGVDAYEIRPIIMHRIHHFTGSFVVCANLLRNSTITNCNSTAHIALLKPATKTTSKNMLEKPSTQKSKGSGNKKGFITRLYQCHQGLQKG